MGKASAVVGRRDVRRGRGAGVLVSILTLVATTLVAVGGAPVATAGAAGVAKTGLAETSAAPSCWSIKQSYPASTDGLYWLWTPKLVDPQQVYCDMTTDGGGWELVGRGREGWSFPYWGQGSPSTLRANVTGPAAFDPATLPTPTVDGLMNGGRMDALTDGIRLRRATNATGTTWQEVRMKVKTFGSWSWAFGGGIPLSSIKFDATTTNIGTSWYQTNTTSDVQVGNDTRRVTTYPITSHNSEAGFSFGNNVTNGSNSPTSYLWEYANENSAIPFTQVFIRPQISEADIAAAGVSSAPDSGLAGSTVRAMLDRIPVSQGWAVTGINVGTAVSNMNDYVKTFAQIGNVVYMGGKFLQVQHGIGGPTFTQSYLAAFDVNTGEWIPTFNPVIDAPVWKIMASPDGTKLFVGGEFTNVNGARAPPRSRRSIPRRARSSQHELVRLRLAADGLLRHPGDVDPGPVALPRRQLHPHHRWGRQRCRRSAHAEPLGPGATDRRPPGLELGAGPQHRAGRHQRQRAGRPRLCRGHLHHAQRPGDSRLLMRPRSTPRPARWSPASSPGWPPRPASASRATRSSRSGDHVYQGGSQHYLHSYARSDYAFEKGYITQNNGGDFQSLAYKDGILYGSCHCVTDYAFEDTTNFDSPTGYSRVDPINLIGAFDMTNNLSMLPEFNPTQLKLQGAGGEGPWALFFDSNGCMWAGGDLVRQGASANPYYGGYEKFCDRDTTAPSTPTNVQSSVAGNDVTLSWTPSTDNATTPIQYEILKDDPTFGTIVVGTTYDRNFTDPGVTGTARYFVRALDATGNRSATTSVISVTPPPPALATLVAHGDTWSYRADGQDLGTAWRQPGFDSSSWSTGTSQLGWGGKGEDTTIPSGPITSYFVKHINVPNAGLYQTITVRLKRDDGAAVYVNGVQAVLDNLPAGALSASTPASSFVSGAAESTWFEYQVPASLFRDGDNTIAVELHQAELNNADGVFDLELVARAATESNPPTAPLRPS